MTGQTKSVRTALLRGATSIAEHLCESAFRSDDRCTWFGATQSGNDNSELMFSFETVGADLYGGCAGIALFLAELYGVSGREQHRETALAAMRQAVRMVANKRLDRSGLYTGSTGVAYAAARICALCHAPELATTSADIARGVANEERSADESDVIEGTAGIVCGLLAISRILGAPDLAHRAVEIGRHFGASATRTERGLSWQPAESTQLTGFGHGSAGLAWSLGELHRQSGDLGLLEAANGAVAHENSWFDSKQGNWADLRDWEPGDPIQCGLGWCTGAPGVGLSRLRLGGTDAARDADIAIATTKHALRILRPSKRFDYSLCHGRSGMWELLLAASRSRGDAEAGTLATEVALRGVEDFCARPDEWPCSVIRGHNPSLMLGTAGIGLSLLRLAAPEVPSVLTVGH